MDARSHLSLPYLLRIGVTGHRNLPDPEGVERGVAGLLDKIAATLASASEYPRGPCGSPKNWTERLDAAVAKAIRLFWPGLPVSPRQTPVDQCTPLEWVVISCLAKGSDRIVARQVLRRPAATLQAVIPFSIDDYRKDFTTPDDRAEFDELLARDPAPTVLERDYGEQSGPVRNQGYLDAGRQVVDACEILIAIWNGEPAAGVGGTGDVVACALEQGRLVIWIDARAPAKPPQVLVKVPPASAGGRPAARPLPEIAKEISQGFHQLAAYNRDAAHDPARCAAIAQRNAEHLRRSAQAAGLADAVLDPLVDRLLPHYARADQLAVRYQQLYVRAALGLYFLAASAVTLAVLQAMFFAGHWWPVVLEIVAMGAAIVLLRTSKTEAWHEKWLHDRHLAERLRSALFLLVLQDDPLPRAPAAETLPFYQGPHGWLSDAVEHVVAEARRAGRPRPGFESARAFLAEGWIASQARWHAANARRKGRALGRAHRLGLLLFAATLVMAAIHLLWPGHAGDPSGVAATGRIVVCLAIVLPAWGAATHAVNTLLERERIAARSSRMASVLEGVAQRIRLAPSWDRLQEEVACAEKIIATENHEWWVLLSFRGLVLPA